MAGFWQGVGDWFGLKPVEDAGDFFQDAASLLSMGAYNPRENKFAMFDHTFDGGPVAAGIKSAFHSAADVSEASDLLGAASGYLGEIMETEATAAKNQADANETAAVDAWKRSEQAADAALARARKFRQTSALDNVQALKAAGLNPVLAASGGFSGSAVTAPQANAPASSSSKADGLNAADLLTAIAALLGGAGSLVGSINPKRIISDVTRHIK